ncbi:hypothetical protein Lbys_3591 [Leadbetterella byssophila DSM 17132]|uniref:Uncharacterized protein n=1 Tax=Leadbetterella byssophila (strain DSM 17132 / JCM 16389 / KACC 11308 / NBRC 106382 / 4M15) TaxID=649349 RepID=E4RZU7_LEAB4|nr:hypothetical protein Lbys_3591 [Leadbetterella byssophila DSM 17132]
MRKFSNFDAQILLGNNLFLRKVLILIFFLYLISKLRLNKVAHIEIDGRATHVLRKRMTYNLSILLGFLLFTLSVVLTVKLGKV